MHSALVSTVVLFLLTSTSTTIAQSHDGLLKQNHHRFRQVKRGGATLHLIGDETVARWNGGSVASLPKPSVVAIPATTSYTNLMDSINAGIGVPVGRPTASPSSSSASSSLAKPALAVSTSKSSSSSSKAASTSSKASSSASKASSSSATSSKVVLAAGRGAAAAPTKSASAQPSKRNLVALNATVSEEVDEDHVNALGRRATGNVTLAQGRGRVASSSSSNAGSTSSIAASASSDIPVANTQAAVSFSVADLTTSQGWGAAFANKYTSMSVNNHAVKGASARSVYRDLWPSILGSIKSGDVVVLQLGHYDSSAPGSSQDTAEGCLGSAPGSGDSTVTITSGCTGGPEVVRTFQGYLTEMCKAVKGKGATCLIASITPKNKWSGSTLNYNSPYTSQAKAAASAAGATYVPHLEAIGKQVAAQGALVAQNYWLSGNALQSNAAGADAFASAFAAAVGCAGVGAVTSGLTAAGKAVTGLC